MQYGKSVFHVYEGIVIEGVLSESNEYIHIEI